jgi:hypothetical protein
MVLMSGIKCVSTVPFGDLSVFEDASELNVAAFLFSNSMLFSVPSSCLDKMK